MKPLKILCVSRYLATGGISGHNEALKCTIEAARAAGVNVVYLWLDGPPFYAPWHRMSARAVQVDRLIVGGGLRLGARIYSNCMVTWAAGLLQVMAWHWPRFAGGPLEKMKSFTESILEKRRVSAANVSSPSAPEIALFRRLLKTEKPDAVLINYAYLGGLAPVARSAGLPACIFTHDVIHQLHATMQTRGLAIEGISAEAEARLLQQADALIAIQAEEAQVLRELAPRATVITVPIPQTIIPPRRDGDADVMLFVGSGTAPNADGIQWFLKEVWPQVKAGCPKARLRICGSVCSLLPDGSQGVELAGMVPDLAPEYEAASVVIAPLLAGSGLKIKIVEAFAHGRPVVATSIGLQGLSAAENVCALRADEPGAFAAACRRVMAEEPLRRQMGEAALNYAREHHSPEASIKPLLAWIRDTAAKKAVN